MNDEEKKYSTCIVRMRQKYTHSKNSITIILDPDVSSRKKPTNRQWLHWLIVNMPGKSFPVDDGIMPGETLAEYVGSAPTKNSGIIPSVYLHMSAWFRNIYTITIRLRQKFHFEVFPPHLHSFYTATPFSRTIICTNSRSRYNVNPLNFSTLCLVSLFHKTIYDYPFSK